jgi:streptogramin lyase
VGAGWLTAGPDAVWAGSFRAISRIDSETLQIEPRRSAAWGPMAYGFGSLWVLGPELERLSPATMRRVATVDLPGGATDIATGLGAVWIADESEAVLRVDPRVESITQTYDVGGSTLGVAVEADAVWAATEAATVARIDPRTDDVTAVPLGGVPRALDGGAGAVWTSVN